MSASSPNLLHTLAWLRWLAVGGQCCAVAWVTQVVGLDLQRGALYGAALLLALFNLWAMKRARRVREAQPLEVLAHLCVDVVTLAWLVALTGGTANPFVSLFLLPIALVAVALPPRWVLATAALCGAGYAAAAGFARPLPHVHGMFGDSFDLHVLGMTVNFVLSAAVLTGFVSYLAHTLRRRDRELAELREQFTRNEGILALATHAASVAHELNTPLATLTLMLEQQAEDGDPVAVPREDVGLMRALVDACRDRVRELAAPAGGVDSTRLSLAAALERVIERWRLLRPEVHLERHVDLRDAPDLPLDAGIGHLLQALLNNAADASAAAGGTEVELELRFADGRLQGRVRDHGRGFDNAAPPLPGTLFRTTKPGGLGVGLALSHATVERLGGELAMEAAGERGVAVSFSLPLVA
ncbi:MAG: ATP-binding protein [Gammaproteobacteria bacterium]